MDKIIDACADAGIVIMLDLHAMTPDGFPADGLWYNAQHPESQVLAGWDVLMQRYANRWNVLAADLKVCTTTPHTTPSKRITTLHNHTTHHTTTQSQPYRPACHHDGQALILSHHHLAITITMINHLTVCTRTSHTMPHGELETFPRTSRWQQ